MTKKDWNWEEVADFEWGGRTFRVRRGDGMMWSYEKRGWELFGRIGKTSMHVDLAKTAKACRAEIPPDPRWVP